MSRCVLIFRTEVAPARSLLVDTDNMAGKSCDTVGRNNTDLPVHDKSIQQSKRR